MRVAVAASIAAVAALAVWFFWPVKPDPRGGFESDVRPVLAAYCTACHGKGSLDGDFASIDREDGFKPEWFKKAHYKLHTAQMPPPGQPQPSAEQRAALVAWVDRRLPTDRPSTTTLRRLNRAEYLNALRDLTGLADDFAADLPADEIGYGFDNIGDVLSIPPLLMEKYLAAAEAVVRRAVVTPDERVPAVRRIEAADLDEDRGTAVSGSERVLYSQAEVYTHIDVPRDAEYVIRATACADQAGPEFARMALRVDARDVTVVDVEGGRGDYEAYEVRATLRAGRRQIGAAFINDYYRPQDKDPKQRDRNLVVQAIEIVGPLGALPPDRDAAHRRIFISREPREILAAFATRAFRRPATDDEVSRLLKLYDQAKDDGFEAAMRVPLTAVLVSPHFLFHAETDDDALAARLASFLWSGPPDDELRTLARTGKLRSALDAQVTRMLADPRASSLAEDFATQWLQIRRLRDVTPDPVQFPAFNDALRDAMLREAVMLFETVMREDRSVIELFDAKFTFVNEPLARLYGIDGVKGDAFQRVTLSDPRRGGVLTMAAVLTSTSLAARTSAVKRGKWVLEAILGTPPPPPLPNVGDIDHDPNPGEPETMRQRLELHRKKPDCIACHARIDPIGFAFENYDAVGAWRDSDNGLPVDASATLPGGRAINGPVDLKRHLVSRKADLVRALAEKLLTYALGRGVEYSDAVTIQEISRATEQGRYAFSSLIRAVVKSRPFQETP